MAELQAELGRILASSHFSKAARSSRLLRYLVAPQDGQAPRLTNEYAIGLAVFARDAATYSTGDDPIVRVQVGRLRERLRSYYATQGAGSALRISIPLGGYAPRVERCALAAPALARLGLAAFACPPGDVAASWFATGLNEELRYRLHQQLGERLACVTQGGQHAENESGAAFGHVLEGSVRADGDAVRTSARLIDVARGCIVWSEQLDHAGDLSIARQQQLASLCCAAAHAHFQSAAQKVARPM